MEFILKNWQKRSAYEKVLAILTAFILIVSIFYSVGLLLLLRENYVFTIHDGLDSVAGIEQMIHDNHLFFSMEQYMPVMNGLERKYTGLAYNLYDLLNCTLGFLPGQIVTRIISVFLGFFCMRHLLRRIHPTRSFTQELLICLVSIAYAITPQILNMQIAMASLPAALDLFLYLQTQKEKISGWIWIAFLYPFFSSFATVLPFIIGFWGVFGLVDWIREKHLNKNLLFSGVLLCVCSLLINPNLVKLALTSEETNRGLAVAGYTTGFSLSTFKGYLFSGQQHAPALISRALLVFLLLGTCYVLWNVCIQKNKQNRSQLLMLLAGWGMWLFSAFAAALHDGGFTIGILMLDGFNWGRIIWMMRPVWYLMLSAVLFSLPPKKVWELTFYGVISLQLISIALAHTGYNESFNSLKKIVNEYKGQESGQIDFKTFFDEELFTQIKEDVSYQGEGVAAYGFHPAVLMYNGFNTVDGYMSVHSMEWQLQFREIIAPALDRYPERRVYYDEWGGRMYLFGELNFVPTTEKETSPAVLYIDTNAFMRYGGRYILSRAEISNAEELSLELINDYDLGRGIYHIYLYQAQEGKTLAA